MDFLKSVKHMLWLIKIMILSFLKGDFKESLEASYWIRIHWHYRGKRMN
jgi:hypothetical protein